MAFGITYITLQMHNTLYLQTYMYDGSIKVEGRPPAVEHWLPLGREDG